MTAIELRDFWHATPFVPFNILLASAERLHIPHPDFLSLSPNGRIALVWRKDGDHTSIDIMLATAVEMARNGSKPPRRRRS